MYWATGEEATVKVSADAEEPVSIWLNGDSRSDAMFRGDGIANIDASEFEGEATLAGNNNDNVITAGAGDTSLWGAGGNDTLIGNDGKDEFFFVKGDGEDVIQNFNPDEDVMNTSDAAVVAVGVEGDDLIISLGENDSVTVEGAAGQNINFTNSYVENETGENASLLANITEDEINYDGTADLYWATGEEATVTVDENAGEEAAIWLNNDATREGNDARFMGDIAELDASNYAGNATLVGNDKDNVITAGSGNNSLWGGASASNDTLIGGEGADLFWYEKGNGDDVIVGSTDKDTLNLYGITLDDISSIDYDNNDIKLNINGGGSLTIKDGVESGVTAKLADGSTYTATADGDKHWTKQ